MTSSHTVGAAGLARQDSSQNEVLWLNCQIWGNYGKYCMCLCCRICSGCQILLHQKTLHGINLKLWECFTHNETICWPATGKHCFPEVIWKAPTLKNLLSSLWTPQPTNKSLELGLWGFPKAEAGWGSCTPDPWLGMSWAGIVAPQGSAPSQTLPELLQHQGFLLRLLSVKQTGIEASWYFSGIRMSR